MAGLPEVFGEVVMMGLCFKF